MSCNDVGHSLAISVLQNQIAIGDLTIHIKADTTEVRDRHGRVLVALGCSLEPESFALIADPAGPAIVDHRRSERVRAARPPIDTDPFRVPAATGRS